MSMRKLSIQVNWCLVSTATIEDKPDDELFEHMDQQDFAMRTADRACSSIAFWGIPIPANCLTVSPVVANTITNSTGTRYPCLDLCNEGLVLWWFAIGVWTGLGQDGHVVCILLQHTGVNPCIDHAALVSVLQESKKIWCHEYCLNNNYILINHHVANKTCAPCAF